MQSIQTIKNQIKAAIGEDKYQEFIQTLPDTEKEQLEVAFQCHLLGIKPTEIKKKFDEVLEELNKLQTEKMLENIAKMKSKNGS